MANQWTDDQKKVIELRDRNILVSAAAGSGKTAVLVERIIQMITDSEKPVDIDRLLVVTFTKAAASEMRERVGAALEERLLTNPEQEHLQRQISLLHNAQITTIDSFCQNIIRNYFHVINLDPVFRVADENELLLQKMEVLEELIEESYQRAREEDDSVFLQFVEIFAQGRNDTNIEKLVLRLHDISTSYPWPKKWLQEQKSLYQCESVEKMQEKEYIKNIMEYVSDSLQNYEKQAKTALRICMEEDGPSQYEEAIQSDLQQIGICLNAKNYQELYEAFSSLNPARLSAKRNADVNPEKKEKVKSIRENYQKNGLVTLKQTYFFQSPEEMWKDIRFMAPIVDKLIDLTLEFTERFAEKKQEENILDFADIEHFALEILVNQDEEGNPVPSETAQELQEYYYEILTDEYQDSNYVQELLLSSLCRAPKNKPHLFMVGDVKQSIYQFRLARPDLFIEKYKKYSVEESAYQRIDLQQNFRSRESVLESANFLFEYLMQESLGGIAYDEAARLVAGRKYDDCEQRIAGKTKIMLMEQNSDLEEENLEKRVLEASAIGMKIRDIVQGENPMYVNGKEGYRRAEYRDIVILLRSMSGWSEDFVETLSDMGIPVYADTRTGYFSAMEVETMLNMLRIIDNPRQDIPMVAVLRSCLGGLSDEELAWIGSLPRTLNYWDAMCLLRESVKEEEKQNLCRDSIQLEEEAYRTLIEKSSGFMERLEHYQEIAQIQSVYELLVQIYHETNYYDIMAAMPAGEKRTANLDILLQQSLEFADYGHRGIFGFTHYIENLQKSNVDFGSASLDSENANAVRIMSIHKSKGLQFPVVFLAGMGKRFNLQDARQATIIDSDYGIGADFVDLELRIKQPTLIKKYLANKIKTGTLSEEIRILYVALTRAEEQLILTGTASNLSKKMEQWEQKATLFDTSTLLSAQTYLDWIMPVVLMDGERLFKTELIQQSDIVEGEKQELLLSLEKYQELIQWDYEQEQDIEMKEALEAQDFYRYPYEAEKTLPVKISVSEIKHLAMEKLRLLEEEAEVRFAVEAEDCFEVEKEDGFEAEKEVCLDAEKPSPTITGAARGTLYHMVMEHLPYDEITPNYNFKKLFEQLIEKGYLSEEEASVLSSYRFSVFCKSEIGKRMKKAAQKGVLRREQPFMLGVTASEVYPEVESQEMILVQGIIDAYFEEEDGIVLVDYKTDYVQKDVQELVDKYRSQMDYYAKALERLTGKTVKEKVIYSFGAGKEVRI